jgi:hypothetical protein
MSAFKSQVGGGHYKDLNPQPLGVLHSWGLPYAEGSAIYYILRWRRKGGLEDLKKAKHTLELLIELEEKQPKGANK